MELLDSVALTEEPDSVKWILEKHDKFTTALLYRIVLHPGLIDTQMIEMCEAKGLNKIKIFLWQLHKDQIQSWDQLMVRKWKGDKYSKWCGDEETANHITSKFRNFHLVHYQR
jgi:hypothetical protein